MAPRKDQAAVTTARGVLADFVEGLERGGTAGPAQGGQVGWIRPVPQSPAIGPVMSAVPQDPDTEVLDWDDEDDDHSAAPARVDDRLPIPALSSRAPSGKGSSQ